LLPFLSHCSLLTAHLPSEVENITKAEATLVGNGFLSNKAKYFLKMFIVNPILIARTKNYPGFSSSE
jgi:hypothetical protein